MMYRGGGQLGHVHQTLKSRTVCTETQELVVRQKQIQGILRGRTAPVYHSLLAVRSSRCKQFLGVLYPTASRVCFIPHLTTLLYFFSEVCSPAAASLGTVLVTVLVTRDETTVFSECDNTSSTTLHCTALHCPTLAAL